LALTMLKGSNTPREYTMQALADSGIAAFASKVVVREDAELTRLYKDRLPARVEVRLKSGAVYDKLVIDARGSAGHPLSSDDLDDKFRSQAADVLGPERCEQVLGILRNIVDVQDVAELPPLLVAARR
jgi:2-methylcitrate dehydratase PrpD